MRQISRDIVSGLVYSSDNKLLMGKKDPSKGGVYKEAWHIPGGGVEDGEDKLVTLRREIFEETNIVIADAEVVLVDDLGRGSSEKILKDSGEKVWCNMHFYIYSVRLTKSTEQITLKPSDELVELKWFDISELRNMKLTPPSVKLFIRLGYLSAEESI